MSMKPLFSIVIPTLNEEKFVPNLLNDLVNQKEKDFEVIVVDSITTTDHTEEEVSKFAKKLNISIIKDDNNFSSARNTGAYHAQGDYLIFFDADAQIGTGFTRILKKSIKNNPGLLYIPAIIPDRKNFEMEVAFRLANSLVDFSQNLNKPFSTGGSMIVERNFFLRIGGFDQKLFLSEDHNLVQRAQKWGVKARFLHNLKLKFSMRRMRKEGAFSLFYKYLISTAYVLFKGDINEKIFSYKMGGSLYEKEVTSKTDVNRYLKIFKDFFRSQLD